MRNRLIVALLAGIPVFLFLWHGFERSRDAARTMNCANNMKQLAIAVHNYHDTYAQLPPVVIVNDKGASIHSWRPTLLPYLKAQQPYYHWDEPWNGPFNRKLAYGLPVHIPPPPRGSKGRGHDGPLNLAWPYVCSCREHVSYYGVQYFAVVGDETAWPLSGNIKLDDISDGGENTVLFVESHNLESIWSEPKDLQFDTMSFVINDTLAPCISSPHRRGPLVAFADCEVAQLHSDTPPHIVRALLTINGGEKNVSRAELRRAGWVR